MNHGILEEKHLANCHENGTVCHRKWTPLQNSMEKKRIIAVRDW
jgi:hypothetical protein